MPNKDYNKLSKDELLKLVEKQEAELDSKKYGLLWDREKEPEQVVLDCENNLPILKRIIDNEIKTNESDDNIFIEGDNYHSLTVLNYTHKGKINFIYIDPPYNTGKKDEWKYNDKFIETFSALLKVIMFDISLALDTYFHTDKKVIEILNNRLVDHLSSYSDKIIYRLF
jgi:adenine specific DNA methylase Mod